MTFLTKRLAWNCSFWLKGKEPDLFSSHHFPSWYELHTTVRWSPWASKRGLMCRAISSGLWPMLMEKLHKEISISIILHQYHTSKTKQIIILLCRFSRGDSCSHKSLSHFKGHVLHDHTLLKTAQTQTTWDTHHWNMWIHLNWNVMAGHSACLFS